MAQFQRSASAWKEINYVSVLYADPAEKNQKNFTQSIENVSIHCEYHCGYHFACGFIEPLIVQPRYGRYLDGKKYSRNIYDKVNALVPLG